MTIAHDMIKAWQAGRVCLHPTDTLPGLSFNPLLGEGEFLAIKRRPPEKKPISLVASWTAVHRVWQPLPAGWEVVLQNLWPASLSVIWLANENAPAPLISADGTVGLRMPAWKPALAWMREALEILDLPFPSSSVNLSSEPAARDWDEALAFAARIPGHSLFVPTLGPAERAILEQQKTSAQASTLIRIEPDGSFTTLRAGAVSSSIIQNAWEQHGPRS